MTPNRLQNNNITKTSPFGARPRGLAPLWLGDNCLTFSLGNCIDPEISKLVLHLFRRSKIHFQKNKEILDIVPSYTELAFYLSPAADPKKTISEFLNSEIQKFGETRDLNESKTKKAIIIPVEYGGPDLKRVAKICGVSETQIISRHSAPDYTVAMIGFLPHFPYLLGLDRALQTPRLDAPRIRVPAGSVAIAGLQAGIYPQESPGGWNILGKTDSKFCRQLEPGSILKFEKG